VRFAAEVCPSLALKALIALLLVITNLGFGKVHVHDKSTSEEKKQEVEESEKKIVVYSLHLHFFFYIWRTTSPGRGASSAEIVRRRFSTDLPHSHPPLHLRPHHFPFSTCITPYTIIPNGRETDVLKRQSATSLRIVRPRSGSATTAANQATSRRPARSLAASPPNNATRAEASATSRQSAQRCVCKARTKNVTYVSRIVNLVRGL
jgi:hypothetical protein